MRKKKNLKDRWCSLSLGIVDGDWEIDERDVRDGEMQYGIESGRVLVRERCWLSFRGKEERRCCDCNRRRSWR